MCRPKAEGGQRCYPHARQALERALEDLSRSERALRDAERAHEAASSPSFARDDDTTCPRVQAQAVWQEAREAVHTARLSLAHGERGSLELLAEADALDDAASTLPVGRAAALRDRAHTLRATALSARTGRSTTDIRRALTAGEEGLLAPRQERGARLDELVTAARRRSWRTRLTGAAPPRDPAAPSAPSAKAS